MVKAKLIQFVRGHNRTEILTRVIVFVCLVGLALAEFLPLLYEYTHNNVATHIMIIGHNETVKPPTVALRIPWRSKKLWKVAEHVQLISENETSSCHLCEKMAEHSWDVWDGMDFRHFNCTQQYVAAIATEILARLYFDSDEELDALSARYWNWNGVLVEAAWHFLDCMRRMDELMDYVEPQNDTNSWCFDRDLVDLFLSNKKKMGKLFERVIGVLCEVVKIEDTGDTVRDNRACFETLTKVPSVLFDGGFQFLLPMNETDGRANVIVTSTGQYGVKEALKDPYKAFYLFTDTDFMSWPPSQTAFKDNILHTTKEIGEVLVGYQVDCTVIERRPGVKCYSENSQATCKSHCLVGTIVEKCHCIPFAFRNHAPVLDLEMPYCNTSYYVACKFDQEKEKRACNTSCLTPCEYVSYEWHTAHIAQRRQWREYNLTLHPIRAPFIQFAVTTKDTRAQFLTQIGSVLNLYLGFSGLTVIAFAVVSGELIKKWFGASKVQLSKQPDVTIMYTNREMKEAERELKLRVAALENSTPEQTVLEMKAIITAMTVKLTEVEEKMKKPT